MTSYPDNHEWALVDFRQEPDHEWAAALYEAYAAGCDDNHNDAYARTAMRLAEEIEEAHYNG